MGTAATESKPGHEALFQQDQRFLALVEQTVAGDSAAFENLYRLSIRTLLPWVQRICGVHAEDVLADTYLQAWKTVDTFDPQRCTVLGWLRTIARSRAQDRLRIERTRHGGMDGAPPFDPDRETHASAGPEESACVSQQRQRLDAALATLKPAQRWVIALAYHRDHSHHEISAMTGMPLGTVKTLILRSHRHLRGMMHAEAATSLPSHATTGTS